MSKMISDTGTDDCESNEIEMSASELKSRVWIIGKRYGHHAKNAGYEGFNRALGLRTVPLPAENRFFSSLWGWRIDQAVARLAGRRFYSLGIFANEAAVAAQGPDLYTTPVWWDK